MCSGYNVVKLRVRTGCRSIRQSTDARLERLLLHTLTLSLWWDFEALFGRVENVLDLLEQTLVLLELRIGLHRLLDQQLDVAQLAEVKVPLALEARDSLLESTVLLAQSSAGGSSPRGKRCACPRRSRVASSWCSPGSRCGGAGCRCGSGSNTALALAAGNGVVLVTGEMLVPVLLDKLEEFEVVLHLALYERLDADGLVDVVLGERVWIVSGEMDGGRGDVLCNTLKFCRYAYSVFALNLTRDMGTSSVRC